MTVLTLHEAHGRDRDVLGGKGESLVRMRDLGLPVPPAIIVATDVSRRFERDGALPDEAWEEIAGHVRRLEGEAGAGLGSPSSPLLVSVRSGAPASMPGMMDTVLNVGITDATLPALRDELGAAADDSYARLRQSFEAIGAPLPQDAWEQLRVTIEAVLRSWSAPRARRYRRFAGIDETLGTAVIVQAMVFGNLADRSGTGVAFTRNPATGVPGMFGDFLAGAQGEDVVGGEHGVSDLSTLRAVAPEAADELVRAGVLLEQSFGDLCDIEFTVEHGRLWVLQARAGQRTPLAAVRVALDLVEEGVIDWDEALRRIPPEALVRLLDHVLDPAAARDVLGTGVAACPGAAVGHAALTPLEAEELAAEGHEVVLVRPTTTPWDIAGMVAARGIVTAAGGRTSHAAVVARGMSKPAVCGVLGLAATDTVARFGEREIRTGDLLSVDGFTGEVLAGALPRVAAPVDPRVETVLRRCDARRRVPVLSTDAAAPWADGVADSGVPLARTTADLADLRGAPRLVVAPGDPDGAVSLVQQSAASGSELVFRVPEAWPPALRCLPPGRWIAVAAGERGRLAARLLAATVEVRA